MGKKRGQPPKQEVARSELLHIRLTPKEKEMINMCAENLGVCKTDAIVKAIELLGKKIIGLNEQGIVKKLSCRIKDTVWIVTEPINVTGDFNDLGKSAEIYECYVNSFSVWEECVQVHLICKLTKQDVFYHLTEKDFGKTVFFTNEEAKLALYEIKKLN